MKKIFESFRKFIKEDNSLFGNLEINSNDKIIVSKDPIEKINTVQQVSFPNYKPKGLWYACGNEWIEWTKAEMPQWYNSYLYIYKIKLKYGKEGVLPISNEEIFALFNKLYNKNGLIDWKKVSDGGFCGVEICPYLDEFRMVDWYYTWDIASGCIWDKKGIVSIDLIAKKESNDKL